MQHLVGRQICTLMQLLQTILTLWSMYNTVRQSCIFYRFSILYFSSISHNSTSLHAPEPSWPSGRPRLISRRGHWLQPEPLRIQQLVLVILG